MKVSIEKKPAFKVAGKYIQASLDTRFDQLWNDLYKKYSHSELYALGSGQRFGVCYDMEGGDQIKYLAGFDLQDEAKSEQLGLDVLEIPDAEYAILKLRGPVPDCIHNGWKYVMGQFFPTQGYRHAGTPDFEVFTEGDKYSTDYQMELWVPIVKEQ